MVSTDRTTTRVGVRELRENLSALLRQVQHGASLLITSRDEVLAELRPHPPTERPARKPGALRGKIRMAADFDQTPDDVIDVMEGKV